MAYLAYDDIRALLAECDKSRAKDLTSIVKICLATGARWSEAEGLKGNQVRAGQIIYVKTKGKKNKAVPVSQSLQAELPPVEKLSLYSLPAIQHLERRCNVQGLKHQRAS